MKKTLLTGMILLSSFYSFCQNETEKLMLAGNDYIDAFYNGDSIKLQRSISPNVIKYGYYRPKDSSGYVGEPMSFREMQNYAASVAKRTNRKEQPRKVEILDMMDKTAALKVTAWWGIDYLLLVKKDNKWMIDYVLWQSAPVTSNAIR